MKRFWISWEQPGEDYRPLSVQYPAGFLGWWCSGYAGDGSYSTLIALTDAESEQQAHEVIRKLWPEAPGGEKQFRHDWRFSEERPDGWTPGDRFPLPARAAKEG